MVVSRQIVLEHVVQFGFREDARLFDRVADAAVEAFDPVGLGMLRWAQAVVDAGPSAGQVE